ncbi:MAG TPA: helix-turn-helix domain-containing protein [bacterium]|nr:helix-turn-helix domain-containing protein [bacterium]
MYTHFNLKERFSLETLLGQDYQLCDIAQIIGRSTSSLSRELIRNSRSDGRYETMHAQMKARRRRQQSKVNSRKIENDKELSTRIGTRLHPLVSPEVIAHDEDVSTETIYAWIARSRADLKILLPQHGKKRRRYGTKRAVKQGWTRHVRPINERSMGAIIVVELVTLKEIR